MSKRDLGASVRQRLLNQARAHGRPFQELLQYYAMERFLYRLSKSQFRESFILKGALLLTAWRAPQSSSTMDIDLLGRTESGLEHIQSVVEELCGFAVEQDGVEFKKDTIEIEKIKEDAEYEGARVRLIAMVSNARLTVQIDIGFGDAIVPRPAAIEYPVLLEFPAPHLLAYPRETVVAEKLEAMTILGLLNSRMKDYFDLMLLSRLYEFAGDDSISVERRLSGADGSVCVRTGKSWPMASISAQEQIRNRLRRVARSGNRGEWLCGAGTLGRGRWASVRVRLEARWTLDEPTVMRQRIPPTV